MDTSTMTVGTAAPTRVLTRSSAAVLPRVNLLPPEIEERRRFRRVQAGMGAAVLAAVGAVAGLTLLAGAQVDDAQAEIDAATFEQQQLQRKVSQMHGVREVYARVAGAETLLTQAMANEIQWSHYLNDLSLTIPSNVWLNNLAFSTTPAAASPVMSAAPATPGLPGSGIGTVTVTGVAFDYDDVASWLESLAKQKGYTNPYFSNATEATIGTRTVVNFSSTATITPDALSGRYTNPAETPR